MKLTLRAPVVSAAPAAPARVAAKPPVAHAARLKLSASRGDCWVSIRKDSATGPELYTGTLVKGKSLSFPLGKLWIRFGAPQNVDAFVGAKKRAVPTISFNVTVTSAGLQPAPE